MTICVDRPAFSAHTTGTLVDRNPCGWVVDQTAEVGHLNALQPVRDEGFVGGELDCDLSVVHESNLARRLTEVSFAVETEAPVEGVLGSEGGVNPRESSAPTGGSAAAASAGTRRDHTGHRAPTDPP